MATGTRTIERRGDPPAGALVYSIADTARVLRCSETYVRMLVRAKKIHAVSMGKRVLVTKAALETFIEHLEEGA